MRAEEADRAGPEYPNHIFPRAICQHRNILRDTENIFKQQRNILEIEIVIERRKDAMMQMLLRFDPSRNASGRHLPLCSTSTKILGSVLEQHTTHPCNGFIGTTLLYAMHSVQDFSSLVQSHKNTAYDGWDSFVYKVHNVYIVQST